MPGRRGDSLESELEDLNGVDGAVCRGPFHCRNGCSWAGRGPAKSWSHSREPMPPVFSRSGFNTMNGDVTDWESNVKLVKCLKSLKG